MARREREKIRGKEISEPTEKKEAVNNSSQKNGAGIIDRIISSNKNLVIAGILGLSALGIYGSYKNSKRETQSNLAPNSGVQSLPVPQRRPRESHVIYVPGDGPTVENGNFPDFNVDDSNPQMLNYFTKLGVLAIRLHPADTINQTLVNEISELKKINPEILKKIAFDFSKIIDHKKLISPENNIPGPSLNSSIGLTPMRNALLRSKIVDIEKSLHGIVTSVLHLKHISKKESGSDKIFPGLPDSYEGPHGNLDLESFIIATSQLKDGTKSALLQKNLLLRIIRARKMHEEANEILKEIIGSWNKNVPKMEGSAHIEGNREFYELKLDLKTEHLHKVLLYFMGTFKEDKSGKKVPNQFILKALNLAEKDGMQSIKIYHDNLDLKDGFKVNFSPLYLFDSAEEVKLAISLVSAHFIYRGKNKF